MEVHSHFGTVQAALNTGEYDQELERVGITGAQGHAKKKGLLAAIGRLVVSGTRRSRNYVARLRSSLRWSGTLIGSISAAMKKEVELVPGAAAAGEAIKEFIEVLLNATEPLDNSEATRMQQRGKAPSDGNDGR